MKKIKIYTLSDPITNEVRYVGKTIQKLSTRYNAHCKRYDIETNYKSSWIKSLNKIGIKPKIEIVEILNEDDSKDWKFWEKYWISQFRQWGFKLTNLTNGGDGVEGCKFPKRKPHSELTKLKISIANKKVNKTTEWINKVAEANKKAVIGIKNDIKYTFKSTTDAAIELGDINYKKNIVACLKGRRKTAYGYKWFYENTEVVDKELLR